MKLCQLQQIIMKNEDLEPTVMSLYPLILEQLG